MPVNNEQLEQIYQLFKEHGANPENFESAIANQDPKVLFIVIKQELRLIRDNLDAHANAAVGAEQQKAVFNAENKLLNSLANNVSDHFKQKMEEEQVYNLQVDEIFTDANKRQALRRLLDYALKSENITQLQKDFANALRNYHAAKAEEIQDSVNRLKPHAGGTHHISAGEALKNTSSEILANKASSGKFDPIKSMGIVFSDLLNYHVVSHISNKYWPDVNFEEKPADPDKDPQRNLSRKMRGMEGPGLK